MIIASLSLLAAAVVIYLTCEYFVNGVEWIGRKAGVGETAVGSILAAFGTALPESVVTLVAVAFSDAPAGKDIGVGAALGGPLALSTIAYAAVGFSLLLFDGHHRAGRPLRMDSRRLARDQTWFLAIFAVKIGLGVVAFSLKPWFGWLFLLCYAVYFWTEMSHEEDTGEQELAPLKCRPRVPEPAIAWALLQTLVALVVIFFASQFFVDQLQIVGPWLGLPPQEVALLLSPVATELPESMNAIIWVRQGKERLALANISGSMMIQATVPTAFGLFFTSWLLRPVILLAGGVTALSITGLLLLVRRGALTGKRLSSFILFYMVFAAGAAWLASG